MNHDTFSAFENLKIHFIRGGAWCSRHISGHVGPWNAESNNIVVAGQQQAEKPCVIFFQPYLQTRQAAFCPSDSTPRSHLLATDLVGHNGAIDSCG